MESERKASCDQKVLDDPKESARNFPGNESVGDSNDGSSLRTISENTCEGKALLQSPKVSVNANDRAEDDVVLPEVKPIICEEQLESIQGTLERPGDDREISYSDVKQSTGSKDLSEVIVKVEKPLCADYRSGSDSESVDSERDSTPSTNSSSDTCSESEEETYSSCDSRAGDNANEKQRDRTAGRDLALSDLPPIEDLKISVPEEACVEVGQISSVVDILVVVESYKGTAALDVDTVLFLDSGRRTLGKVFDILGPITEPIYTVRFNSQDQINALGIKKGQKVYYAPKTQHTMFVFLSEVLKNKGSDASWKDNIEAPSEFQDFSDDEEERLQKNKQNRKSFGDNGCIEDFNQSRKRTFCRSKKSFGVVQPSRFRHPGALAQRRPHAPRHPSSNQFIPPPPFPTPHSLPSCPPYPPPIYHPPRFSGPPFPTFRALPFPNHPHPFHYPFFQPRTHPRPFLTPPPPPPPPAHPPPPDIH